MTDKRELKRERTRGFFIEATREMIRNEGIEQTSIRKISDKAGYAVSTFYQHFENMEQMLLEVKKEFMAEMYREMSTDLENGFQSVQAVKDYNHRFMDFFIRQPQVYQFFFMNLDSSSMGNFDRLVFDESFYGLYRHLWEKGVAAQEDIPMITKAITYGVHGMLRLYFSSYGISREQIMGDVDEIIDYLF